MLIQKNMLIYVGFGSSKYFFLFFIFFYILLLNGRHLAYYFTFKLKKAFKCHITKKHDVTKQALQSKFYILNGQNLA